MAEQCEMVIGFLVPHRCEHPALGRCSRCSRGFCEEHVKLKQSGLVCLACEQGLDQPVALPMTARHFTSEDLAVFAAASAREDQDSGDTFSDLS